MDWYGPLTIMPSVGLIIMSTSNFTVGLIGEIERLEEGDGRDTYMEIIEMKLQQLKRLSVAISLLYASILLLLIASFANYWAEGQMSLTFDVLMILVILTVATALIILFIYSLKATQIRQRHLKL